MDVFPSQRRQWQPNTVRKPFCEFASKAIRRRVRESNAFTAHWVTVPNLAWVRWTREDGGHVYCAMRRRGDRITAELGTSREPMLLDDLAHVRSLTDANRDHFRIELGPLMHGHDRWWSSGGSENALIERIDWLAQQLQLRLHAFVTAPLEPRT